MAVNKTSAIFHIVALIHHFTVWYVLARMDVTKLASEDLRALKKLKNMGGRFLTNWNFFQQTLYFSIALFLDLLPILISSQNKLVKKLTSFNGFNFTTIVIPFSLYIPLLFWSVFNYDRSLVYPKALDLVIPVWANHGLHSVILVMVIVELFLTRRRPPFLHKAFVVLTLYAGLYSLVLVATYFQHGVWLYEYLTLIGWPARLIYFGITYGLLVLFLKLGHSVQTYLYKRETSTLTNGASCSKPIKKRS